MLILELLNNHKQKGTKGKELISREDSCMPFWRNFREKDASVSRMGVGDGVGGWEIE